MKKLKINKTLTTKKKLYISGPMSGKAEWNFPLFNKVDDALTEVGDYTVYNPAKLESINHDWVDCLQRDIGLFCSNRIDGIVLLDGWELSKGATAEVYIGQLFGADLYKYDEETHSVKSFNMPIKMLLYNGDGPDTITDEEWAKMAAFSEKNSSFKTKKSSND